MTAKSFTEAFTAAAERADFAKRRTEAMSAARHAIIALRVARNVPDNAHAHGYQVAAGCVVRDLGEMADSISEWGHDHGCAVAVARRREAS